MKMQNLKKVNISHVALHALFIPCDRPDLAKKVEPGVQDTVKIVTEMLSRDMDDSVVRIDDAIEMIGGNPKKMRKHINDAIRISCDEYVGNFGRPPIIPADSFIYIVAALAMKELGRFAENLDEYIVMTQISDFIDIGAIENEHDMSCYVMLNDYFIECLVAKERLPLTPFIRDPDRSYVTSRRVKKFFRKNGWYDNPEELWMMLRIDSTSTPTMSQITTSLLRLFKKLRKIELEVEEDYELHKAFDQKK